MPSLQTSSIGSVFLNNYILNYTLTFKTGNVKNKKFYNPNNIKELINIRKYTYDKIGKIDIHSKKSYARNQERLTAAPWELCSKHSCSMWAHGESVD